ncbi:hypothetical protein CK505_12535 [Kocuria sp. WN036]|uniref:hypothetical protein n=1 Tax=Kocuria sp. WN036 TaxID=2032628 RepID=UPI000BABB267|nr:hypothetical protein [Kocuria sp. WN036]PAU90100.1 hypothetical protein CK505_12535 [Kocuria sp. WN036]
MIDALDPGPAGDFPHLPRTPDGYLDTTRMPVGPRHQLTPDGRRVLIDVTPTVRTLDGRLVPVTDVVPVAGQ